MKMMDLIEAMDDLSSANPELVVSTKHMNVFSKNYWRNYKVERVEEMSSNNLRLVLSEDFTIEACEDGDKK